MRELDREQPIGSLIPLETALGDRVASRRLTTFLMALFAATALAIAGVGNLRLDLLPGRATAAGVRRARGPGSTTSGRPAAGSGPRDGDGGGWTGPRALVLSRGIEGLLFSIGRFDARSYALSGIGLLLVRLTAAVSPVIRALRADPLTALREE